MNRIAAQTSSMEPITLGEMDSIRLMNRTDSKYLTDTDTLACLLQRAAAAGYLIFEAGGCRICTYDSQYFDTDDYRMYLDHHNRRLTRQKVRTRIYVDGGGESYLEIKLKNNHGRTRKKRTRIGTGLFDDFRGDVTASEWLAGFSSIPVGTLSPSVGTQFRRITLVDPQRTERVTIDTDVRFANRRSGVTAGLGRAVIIEIKQDGHKRSPMRAMLLDLRVKPYRISKYCIGVAMTAPGIRSGRFKRKLRRIETMNDILDNETKQIQTIV